jgi:hypothetical protein
MLHRVAAELFLRRIGRSAAASLQLFPKEFETMRLFYWIVPAALVAWLMAGALGPIAAQEAKTVHVQSKTGKIQVISDREESVAAYFQRNRLVVAGMSVKELNKCL